jgi:membrane associated rhomboid family serine protease
VIPLKDDNPSELKPVVAVALIVACVSVFLWQSGLDGPAIEHAFLALGAIPAVLSGDLRLEPQFVWVPAWATVLTSMFLHGGWLHLGGNMLYLWIFGDNVEDAFGHFRFAAFYAVCGAAAVAAQVMPAPHSQVPMVGASGAISGVLGAYLLLYPRARILVAIPLGLYLDVRRLPAIVVLALWFVMQLVSSLLGGGHEGIAFRAHVGGFVAGLALAPWLRRPGVPLLRYTRMERR